MLYIVGLGLNVEGISQEGLKILKKCKKVYLENYTVEFPYSGGELKEKLNLKKVLLADREFVESLKIVDEAKKLDVVLLVYGSPLFATTHISLIDEAKKSGIKYKIIYNSSVFDALGETGLQLYKFGKITSMPTWDSEKNFAPDSFMDIVKENKSIQAHSLILVDIGLDINDCIESLKSASKKYEIKLEKIIICERLGTKDSKIRYLKLEEIERIIKAEDSDNEILKPYCIIIPGKLHFLEKEYLNNF